MLIKIAITAALFGAVLYMAVGADAHPAGSKTKTDPAQHCHRHAATHHCHR